MKALFQRLFGRKPTTEPAKQGTMSVMSFHEAQSLALVRTIRTGRAHHGERVEDGRWIVREMPEL